jgi:hypothetical protein
MDVQLIEIYARNTGAYFYKTIPNGFSLKKIRQDTTPFWETWTSPLSCKVSLMSDTEEIVKINAFIMPNVQENKIGICAFVKGDSFMRFWAEMEDHGFAACEPIAEYEDFFESVRVEEELDIQEEYPGMCMQMLYFSIPCQRIVGVECDFPEEESEEF